MKAKSLIIFLSASCICMIVVGMLIANILLRVLTSVNVTADPQMASQWVTLSAIFLIFIGVVWQVKSRYSKRS